MPPNGNKCYYVRINLNSIVDPIAVRLGADATAIKDEIVRISSNNYHVIPPSAKDGIAVLGFLVETDMNANHIKQHLIDPTPRTSPIKVRDEIMVFEIGADYAFERLDSQRTWLTRNAG